MDLEVLRGRASVSPDLARAAVWLSKQVEVALTAVELSPPQYRVLSFLDEGSAESLALARRLAVRPPSVTSVIDGLASRGLVERQPVEDDRRRVRHVLTDQGRVALERADAAVGERLGLVAACLGDDAEMARALDGLAVWRRAMVAYRQGTARP
jgi:DNA-binding MarR family transcriptional regulator